MAVDAIDFPLIGRKLSGATISGHTSLQRGTNGEEVRNADWQDSLRRFDVTPGIKTLRDQATVETFHLACQGSAIGFLMKDWKDYSTTQAQTVLDASRGIFQQGTTSAVSGSTTVFQLEKMYSNGVRVHRRKITRPLAGTIQIYVSGSLVGSGYSIDYTTGRVTFTSAPAATPTWSGSFLVPVRFESDEIAWDVIAYRLASGSGHGDMPEVVLIEVRE